MTPEQQDLIVIAAGEDRVGLVERIAQAVTDAGCNIEESRMAALAGQFALLTRISGPWHGLSRLESGLPATGHELGLDLVVRRAQGRPPKAPLIPYQVDVVAMDHPGIVQSLANFFSRLGINIESLDTETYPAPHTGAPMFALHMTVGIPAEARIPHLRADFLDYCDDLNLDATFEPVRG